jgi:hypothetical protein
LQAARWTEDFAQYNRRSQILRCPELNPAREAVARNFGLGLTRSLKGDVADFESRFNNARAP